MSWYEFWVRAMTCDDPCEALVTPPTDLPEYLAPLEMSWYEFCVRSMTLELPSPILVRPPTDFPLPLFHRLLLCRQTVVVMLTSSPQMDSRRRDSRWRDLRRKNSRRALPVCLLCCHPSSSTLPFCLPFFHPSFLLSLFSAFLLPLPSVRLFLLSFYLLSP